MFKLIMVVLAIIGAVSINEKVNANGGWEQWLIAISSEAVCVPQSVDNAIHIYTDKNGDPDFGYQVKSILKNEGKAGKFWVDVLLKTPEGEWHRNYVEEMKAGESKIWTSDFPEPTIRSDPDSITSLALCRPGHDKVAAK